MSNQPKEVAEALEASFERYKETHELTPEQEDEVRKDFSRFYAKTLSLGVGGIRWNFNGCIMCGENGKLHRVLLIYPQIMLMTNRTFGCLACDKHIHLANGYHEEMLDAAFRRLKRDPIK